jgi:NAD(P)-dependent dehydrogenase (short-subunit alcohol dehydrogenase family)
MRLKGKIALITGGGAGIGRACVELFCQEGARVIVGELNEDTGTKVQDLMRRQNYDCRFIQTDVSQPESVKALVDQIIADYGRIDILYNNVGGSTLTDAPVNLAPFEEFWKKMRVDVFGVWLGCHYVIPHMIAQGGGSIVNATSICALIGMPGRDSYTAAKGAVAALTRSMAVEYAQYKIRVNAVSPGVTATERVMSRVTSGDNSSRKLDSHLLGIVEPLDVAQAVVYLASDEARSTTGHILSVDSGASIS